MGLIISPHEKDIPKLEPPPTKAEKIVLELFKTELPEGWEIYVRPHLNGSRPDFVLLNQNVGIAAFSVKDCEVNVKNIEGAIREVDGYKIDIFNIYCPRLERSLGISAITAGVIFPFGSEELLKRNLRRIRENDENNPVKYSRQYPITGTESVKNRDIKNIYPGAFERHIRVFMNKNTADDLRSWLIEPDFSAVRREHIELSEKQKNLVFNRTEKGLRRIRGPAGSGKSIVICARASHLAKEHKKILVVSFNILLLHYLRDLTIRCHRVNPNLIVWLNFHNLCKIFCRDNGIDEYKEIWKRNFQNSDLESNKNSILRFKIPQLILSSLINNPLTHKQRYDAILVDEGQDFDPLWWDVLCEHKRDNGEMLLASDSTQDIFGTGKSWTFEKMSGAGFRGDWNELETTYRLPDNALELAKIFARDFMPKDQSLLPKKDNKSRNFFYPDTLNWLQVQYEQMSEFCAQSLFKIITEDIDRNRAMTDLTFLTDLIEVGRQVAKILENKGVKTINTFADNNSRSSSQNKKFAFSTNEPRVKITTLHSFKGLETRLLVIGITRSRVDDRPLLYSGITRLKKHEDGSFLTVVCSEPGLEEFGRMWPKFTKTG